MVTLMKIIISTFTLLILQLSGINAEAPEIAGGADHPCYRECIEDEPMTCTYNYSVTSFTAMNVFCKGCPENVTACYNEGCIASGGIVRPVTVINRRIPGPGILVCEGDTVVVNVFNNLDTDGLTVQWHGLEQKHTPWMDGTPYLTQCPITAHDSFQYKFLASPAGTHMLHAHTGAHEADGVFGALVVRRPVSKEPNGKLYDHDLAEHTIVIWHWLPESTAAVIYNAHNTGQRSFGAGYIINGKGGFENFTGKHENTYDKMPREVFTVEKGQKYRFRTLFQTALNCPLQFSIDNHKLLIIASDSAAVEPVEVDSYYMGAGERFDFVLTADKEVDNYWVRIRGLGECNSGAVKVHQEAILRYAGAPETLPTASNTYDDGIRHGVTLNPARPNSEDYSEDTIIMLVDLNNTDTDQTFDISGEPLNTTYVSLALNRYSNYMNGAVLPQMNDVTFTFPSVALFTQKDEVSPDAFCTGEVVDRKHCDKDFCTCTYVLEYPKDELIEIVMVDLNATGTDHPMHAHGKQFQVVAMGVLEDISVDKVRKLNEEGKIPKKLIGAPLKDTVAVPAGGYAIIRLRSTNPGYWFFHCHVSQHMTLGMFSILKFGDHSEMADPPADFPKCRNWKLSE